MKKELAHYFFDKTSEALSFLAEEHSFSAPELEVHDNVGFAFVTFVGENLAVECSVDEREGDVSCVIARVADGKKATYADAIDERDEDGVRVREHLVKLLIRRGVRERLLTTIAGLGLHERIPIVLTDFAQMLRRHGQEVLDDSPTALD